jgi:hypothetical protein
LDEAPFADLREDPQKTLFRYSMSPSGGRLRKSWPLPSTSAQQYHDEVSSGGCGKKTTVKKGMDERCMLMFWHCLRHNTCVGWHTMPGGEGRRDVLASLYSFKAIPPQQVFYDFACSASDTALNTLPEYFKQTQWLHDLFHFGAHKCSDSGKSSRYDHLVNVRTPVMERVSRLTHTSFWLISH